MIYLRPHHINCIYFFVGKGYDEAFVSNMNKTIDTLNKNKSTQNIKFVCNCDFLCKKCPNKKNKNCITKEHVLDLDGKTIREYKLNLNKLYSFEEIIEKYYLNYDATKFTNICESCEWYKNGTCSTNKIKAMIKKFQAK